MNCNLLVKVNIWCKNEKGLVAAMTCFHNFTAAVWQIFAGNLLLLICSIFYLVWWVVCFGPNADGKTAGGSAGVVCCYDSCYDRCFSQTVDIGTANRTYLDSIGAVRGHCSIWYRAFWVGTYSDTSDPGRNCLRHRYDLLHSCLLYTS